MKNYPFKKVIKDPELFSEYLNLAKYLKPKNALDCKPIQQLSWGLIKETQYNLTNSELNDEFFIDLFEKFTGYKIKDIYNLGIIDFFYQVKWIMDELMKLSEKEMNFLNSELMPEQIEAGYEDLQKFGYKATTHALSGKDILKHEAIEAIPYEDIFFVLYLEKTTAEIETKLYEIRTKK